MNGYELTNDGHTCIGMLLYSGCALTIVLTRVHTYILSLVMCCCNQMLVSVLLVPIIVLKSVWNWTEVMSPNVLMDMS